MTRASAARKTVTRGRRKTVQTGEKFVRFAFDGHDYVLDLGRNRVYENFTAVEASKGFAILGFYRQLSPAQV
jgi:hypothetical protein